MWGHGDILYLGHTDVHTLAVTMGYSFARCHHWENLDKGYFFSLCAVSYNCIGT